MVIVLIAYTVLKKRKHIRLIFDKFVRGRNSPEELGSLFCYFGESAERELREVIDDELERPLDDSTVTANEQSTIDRIDRQVYAHIDNDFYSTESYMIRQSGWRLIYRWAIAAAILLIGAWGAICFYSDDMERVAYHEITKTVHDQNPGGNRAVLNLADGRTLVLREDVEGIVVGSDEVTYDNGLAVTGVHDDMADQLNTIQTPRGGQYRIILPDGTKVWLNAASSLCYPGRFVGSERRVELNGEGYFEVVRDESKKFKVFSNGQEVEVLGTKFNINTYSNEPYIRTTLVEGAVRVIPSNGEDAMRLLPGQQSKLGKNGLAIEEVDVKAAVAWKDNDFMFKGQDLRTIMRQLARWYDVDVRYTAEAPAHLKLGGSVSRDNRLSSVLQAIESTNSVRFDFDGKTILVKSAD